MVATDIQKLIEEALQKLGIEAPKIVLDHPTELSHGDYASNVALALSKVLGRNPRDIAEQIVAELSAQKPTWLETVEVAGPGFINFYLSKNFFNSSIKTILQNSVFGKNNSLEGKKIIVEYTDPNPFKEFHIGHLMANTVGETLSRIIEWNGAETKRACYQGDKGIHVASALWGIQKQGGVITDAKALGAAYALGATAYKTDEQAKQEIIAINKKIYDESDPELMRLYEEGRAVSLQYFESLYKLLGTQHGEDGRGFNYYFFERNTGIVGAQVVRDFLGRGVFEESQGAIIFPGEKHGLHTRVFINAEGIPTYEAKELGLAKVKYDTFPYDESVVVTGNEVDEYFKVLLCAMRLVFPELAERTKHISHGMMRLPTGKMSSRTGDVITAESLIDSVGEEAKSKMADRNYQETERESIAKAVAIAAIKYSILRQAPGKDIIFDQEKSLSFEGDSGPYLQYSLARTHSLLRKAKEKGLTSCLHENVSTTTDLERLLYRLEEIVREAYVDFAPHKIISYLTLIAQSFNSFYANTPIIVDGDSTSEHRLAITEATGRVLTSGLTILGIQPIEYM